MHKMIFLKKFPKSFQIKVIQKQDTVIFTPNLFFSNSFMDLICSQKSTLTLLILIILLYILELEPYAKASIKSHGKYDDPSNTTTGSI